MGQAQTGRDAEHMGIDRHRGLVKNDRSNHISGLAPHAGQTHQVFHRVGNLPAKVGLQHLGHPQKMGSLVVGIGNRLDIGINLLLVGTAHRKRIGETCQQGRGHHVDPFVGTLGRENDGHQQFVGVLVMQLALGKGVVAGEPVQDLLVMLVDVRLRTAFPFCGFPAPGLSKAGIDRTRFLLQNGL